MMTESQKILYHDALRMYFENKNLLVLLNALWAMGARGNQHAQQRVEKLLCLMIRHRRDHHTFKEMRTA